MIITKVDQSLQAKLQRSLYTYTNSFTRRGVNIGIFAHSESAANITIRVTGLKGTVEKNIVLFCDSSEVWVAFSENWKYELLALSDITTIIKNQIQKLGTITSKI